MESPDKTKKTRVLEETAPREKFGLTINAINRERGRTTKVLMNVATLLSVFFIPHLARIEVIPAKKAERKANKTHISLPFILFHTTLPPY